MVDAVVRAVLEEVCSLQAAQHGMGWEAWAMNLVFYVDDGRIEGRDHEWVQDALTVMVAMFWRMGLGAKLYRTKVMMCTPGFIWEMVGGMAYKIQATGEGATFRERKKESLSCATCGVTVAASYLKAHMAKIHGIFFPQTRVVDEVGGVPTTYVVSFPKVIQEVRCPVPGCPVVSHSAGRLREHFMFCHFRYRVVVV